ncbi:MAG: hypothetical protein QOC71_70, partial [Thermoplasmata archaeon]|nr:hypothetical protein [Thermoplasmata archaeon]
MNARRPRTADLAEPRGTRKVSARSAGSAVGWSFGLAAAVLVLVVPTVAADNCSGPEDCEATADYNNGIAIGGGIVAVIIATTVAGFGPPGTGTVLLPPGGGPPDPFAPGNLVTNDGRWPDVKKGDKWWPGDGGSWRSPEEIDRLIRERNEQIAKNQEEARKEKEWIAKEDERNDRTWEENKEWSSKGTTDRRKVLEKEAADEQKEIQKELQKERDRKRLEELKEQNKENIKAQEREGSWTAVKEEFWDKTEKEVTELPGDLQKLGRDVVRGTFKGGETLVKELTTWENWRVAGETIGGTVWDATTGPGKLLAGDKKTWDNVVNTVDTVGKVGGHIVNEIRKDPVEFVKGLTPIKAWEEAMDPNKPLIERIGRTWWATVDTILTVEGIGKALGKGGTKLAGEAADDAVNAARKALGERKLPPKVSPKELADLNKDWEKTRAIAKGRVTEFERAGKGVEEAVAKGDQVAIDLAK